MTIKSIEYRVVLSSKDTFLQLPIPEEWIGQRVKVSVRFEDGSEFPEGAKLTFHPPTKVVNDTDEEEYQPPKISNDLEK
jgi:hypothetical protein